MSKLTPALADEILSRHFKTAPREQIQAEIERFWTNPESSSSWDRTSHCGSTPNIAQRLYEEFVALSDPSAQSEINETLEQALSALTDNYQRPVRLRLEQSLSCAAIAKALNTDEKQANRLLCGGLTRLLKAITPCLLARRDDREGTAT